MVYTLSRYFHYTLVVCVLFWQSGCFVRNIQVTALEKNDLPISIESALRVHTLDGEVLVFKDGASFTDGILVGSGIRYGLNLQSNITQVPVASVPIDSIAALEYITNDHDPGASATATLFSTPLYLIGGAALYVAIFGSCPTLYSAADTTAKLEAEVFSNSIVPLFEMRDVDRLTYDGQADGRFELELRNEALETHYINHVELLEVQHDAHEVAVNDALGQVYLLSEIVAPVKATDSAGRDVTKMIGREDSLFFSTDENILAQVDTSGFRDAIDLVFPPVDTDTVALYFRLRNSLLSTVILYDYMLDAQGANAINWMTETLNTIGGAVKLGQFYQRNMGMRLFVWNGEAYVLQDRIGHTGPIAWDEVTVPFPVLTSDSLRVRIDFVADAWRIDAVAMAANVNKAKIRAWPVDEVVDLNQSEDKSFQKKLSRPDEAYGVTFPGQAYTLSFVPEKTDLPRTFFIAAQGYYTEWIRGSWIQDDVAGKALIPSDALLVDALRHWGAIKNDFEQQFFESKLPVR